jgi:hypothetical protein|eukprot:Transcript_7521.p1 GENE.Transcript_7521~~Transcript_7521.p1  ORF type:complete len:241 (-),score=66.07 Transcript_7521:104-826(-)
MVLRLFLGVLLAPASVTAVIEIKPGKVVQDQMLSPTRSPVLQTGRSISVVVPKHISGQPTTVELPSGEPLHLPDGLKAGSVVDMKVEDTVLVETWSEKRIWSKKQRRWRTKRTTPDRLSDEDEDEDEDGPVAPRFLRVPDGLKPGDTFRAFAGGKRFDITVPEGAGGGAVMQMPAAAIAAAVPSKKKRLSLMMEMDQSDLELDDDQLEQLQELQQMAVMPDSASQQDLSAFLAQFAQEVS